MDSKTIGFIGGGRITKIFLQAFKNKKFSPSSITVYDPDVETLINLNARFPGIVINNSNITSAAECDMVFLAVHPPVLVETLSALKNVFRKDSILVSLAPKITINKIQECLGKNLAIARVNPSAAGIINEGINPVCFSESATGNQKKTVIDLLFLLGTAPIVEESKLEAYAVISAMGSTYFNFQFDLLKQIAVDFGLDEEEAKETISAMVSGTINSLFYSGFETEEIMNLVPVKPIGEYEPAIKEFYSSRLNAIFQKIKP